MSHAIGYVPGGPGPRDARGDQEPARAVLHAGRWPRDRHPDRNRDRNRGRRGAARKQPRGVFTITDLRYDDGRPDLRLPLREHFPARVREYNRVVFDSGQRCAATYGDVFALPSGRYDVVYLDPPYAPPRDDNCYVKRYHFLEGLSAYWRGQAIMQNTRTKKLPKRYTPFSYKHAAADALRRTFRQFEDSVIVLSYSSNAVPDAETIEALLREVKDTVEVRLISHKYSFGSHSAAHRRDVSEYLFIGR